MINNITDHDHGLCKTMAFCNQTTNLEGLSSVLSKPNPLAIDDLLKGNEELIPNENDLLDDLLWSNNKKDDNQICEGCKKVMGKINQEVRDGRGLKNKLLARLLATCPKDVS